MIFLISLVCLKVKVLQSQNYGKTMKTTLSIFPIKKKRKNILWPRNWIAMVSLTS